MNGYTPAFTTDCISILMAKYPGGGVDADAFFESEKPGRSLGFFFLPHSMFITRILEPQTGKLKRASGPKNLITASSP
jgi:hypothetical protein